MQVRDLFQRLSFGELSNLDIGMEGAGTIEMTGQPRVVSQIDVALTALHSRFILRRAYLPLELKTGQYDYELDCTDLIKILSIDRLDDATTPDLDESVAMPLNSGDAGTGQVHGGKIMAHNRLHFRAPVDGARYLIEYQANHPKLALPPSLDQEISIMPALEEALQVRVAAGIFSGMGGDGHNAKAAEYLNRFEQLCQMAKLEDMAQESSSDTRDRLRDKGFV